MLILLEDLLEENLQKIFGQQDHCFAAPSIINFDQLYMDLCASNDRDRSCCLEMEIAGLRSLHVACALGCRYPPGLQ